MSTNEDGIRKGLIFILLVTARIRGRWWIDLLIKGHSETIILETRDRADERDHNTQEQSDGKCLLIPSNLLTHKNIVFIKLHFTMMDSYSIELNAINL